MMRFTKVLLLLCLVFSLSSCAQLSKALGKLGNYYDDSAVDEATAGKISKDSDVRASIHQVRDNQMENLGNLRGLTKLPAGTYTLSVGFDSTQSRSLSPVSIQVTIEKGKTYYLYTSHYPGGKWRPIFTDKKRTFWQRLLS